MSKKLHRTHPLYATWLSMIRRCIKPKDRDFKYYGARGVSVCIEWQEDFWAFATYVGERPKGLSIDRINNDGNYEPGNVRWATKIQQGRNTSRQKNPLNGVFFDKRQQKWGARIQVDRCPVSLGAFTNQEDAIAARKAGELKYWGEG